MAVANTKLERKLLRWKNMQLDGKAMEYIDNYVKNHPYPDKPVLFAGYEGYSFKQLASEVRNKTLVGMYVYQSFRDRIRREIKS